MCAIHVDLPSVNDPAEMTESRSTAARLATVGEQIHPQFVDKNAMIGPIPLDL